MIKTLRKIHLLVALISSVFMLLLCLSGALLLFAPTLDKLIFPSQWQVSDEGAMASISAMTNVVERETESKIMMIEPGRSRRDVWRFKLQSGRYANLDPYRLIITKHYTSDEYIYGFTMQFHRWLLLKDSEGNKPLQDWVSIVASALIINMLIGFTLWAKPKARLKRLKIKRTRNRKILFSQLHSVLGVFCALPLVLIALSGIAFNWQTPTKWLMETLTLGSIESRPKVNYSASAGSDLPLATLVAAGQAALAQGELHRIYLANAQQPLRLRLKMPQESHPFSWVWVDPKTAQVLASYDAQQASLATRVWNFKYKFHIGQFISPHMEWLWLFLCLMPLGFLYTGLWLRLKRGKR